MPGGFSLTIRRSWLDSALGTGTPASVRIRLLTGAPGSYVEVAVSGYTSAVITNDRTSFPVSTANGNIAQMVSGIDISFGVVASAASGITAFRIEDSANPSTVILEDDFASPFSFLANQEILITAGNLILTVEDKP